MSGSIIGKLFKISTWGESHGKAIGVVIDGCPSGLHLTLDDIQKDLNLRKPNKSKFSTKRNENDKVEILSGIFENKTTGTPISLIIYNNDFKIEDYKHLKNIFRPGHADFTYTNKYGFRDYLGGGRSSGRETIGRVAAGAVARKFLSELNINVKAYTYSIGEIKINKKNIDISNLYSNDLNMPDKSAYKKAVEYLKECIKKGDSAGGIIECIVENLPIGIGEPVFEKLDAMISKSIISIGGTKGIEFGNGFECSYKLGSENNDEFYYDKEKNIKKYTNNSGGILGGISDGYPIIFKTAFKPTPSISKNQKSISIDNKKNIKLSITGRHDPCIVPRAVIVVEAMTCITIADYILQNSISKISNIKKIYKDIINKGDLV